MANYTPLEVRWVTYTGRDERRFGEKGWATIPEGSYGRDYIWYGPTGDDEERAVRQACAYNERLGFGSTCNIVRLVENDPPFEAYQPGGWIQ